MTMTAARLRWCVVALLGVALPARAGERIDISAPILPQVMLLYGYEGPNFPSTLLDEQDLAHGAALVFETLLEDCRTNVAYDGAYAGITAAPADGEPPLTATELATNYNLVAHCAYDRYTAKPYWIPKLVDDVDVCGTELGAGWGMISEPDLADLSEDDFTFIQSTLSTAAGDSYWGGFYFSLRVYVRAADGTLQVGDLTPGVTPRVIPLPATVDGTATSHLEGVGGAPVVLRCLRRTPL
jgi:hypothetical protein